MKLIRTERLLNITIFAHTDSRTTSSLNDKDERQASD